MCNNVVIRMSAEKICSNENLQPPQSSCGRGKLNSHQSADSNDNCRTCDTKPFEHQVAGHRFIDSNKDKVCFGMLKHKDGYVLKPVEKRPQGDNEIKFYKDLEDDVDPVGAELRQFVPRYQGVTHVKLDGMDVRFLLLEDLTEGVSEPCIMDVKIGKQTWDPFATPEKQQAEDTKYRQTKQVLGFCIPGLQTYHLTSGEVLKLGKEYGKNLTEDKVKDAFKLYLNGESGLSRTLILQFLSKLWRILRWCRNQRKFLFYASSILLVYDARKLRHYLKTECQSSSGPNLNVNSNLPRPHSPSQNSDRASHRKPESCNGWHSHFENISKNHSLVNNYEKDLQAMKENYSAELDELLNSCSCNVQDFTVVKMIDFAHAVPANGQMDTNYIYGLENLVKTLEALLEQVP